MNFMGSLDGETEIDVALYAYDPRPVDLTGLLYVAGEAKRLPV